jgi:hypothetical protein
VLSARAKREQSLKNLRQQLFGLSIIRDPRALVVLADVE